MANERYVKISMRDRWALIPLDANGDPAFEELFVSFNEKEPVTKIFTNEEIVHLVNRALYVMKYQKETHANRRRLVEKTPQKVKDEIEKNEKRIIERMKEESK